MRVVGLWIRIYVLINRILCLFGALSIYISLTRTQYVTALITSKWNRFTIIMSLSWILYVDWLRRFHNNDIYQSKLAVCEIITWGISNKHIFSNTPLSVKVEIVVYKRFWRLYRWQEASGAYLSESWKRNVMWYVKDDAKLGYLDTDKKYRLEKTVAATAVSRKLLAFQVSTWGTQVVIVDMMPTLSPLAAPQLLHGLCCPSWYLKHDGLVREITRVRNTSS